MQIVRSDVVSPYKSKLCIFFFQTGFVRKIKNKSVLNSGFLKLYRGLITVIFDLHHSEKIVAFQRVARTPDYPKTAKTRLHDLKKLLKHLLWLAN